jgi:S1-C subfamily serine protease
MKKLIIGVSLVIALGLLGWIAIAASQDGDDGAGSAALDVGSVDLNQSEAPLPPSDTAKVVEKVVPSVVNVRVTALTQDPFGDVQQGQGEGSGVVIDADGVIVTNFHVVSEAVDVEVVLNDGRKLEGRVVGGIPERDLAVVKVNADGLEPIELGSSKDLRLGDDVIAIGYPLGLGPSVTVTKGILSAEGRTIDPEGANAPLTNMLQTDAAINPGNSGGALVDASGRLVGINSAAAGAGTAENIGFAIPIDSAVPVIREILDEPAEQHAWLGVTLQPLTPVVAAQLDLPAEEGALITSVLAGSPAEQAGLEQGDAVTAVDGESITDADQLIGVLGDKDPGDRVELTLVSSAGERTQSVTLEQRPPVFES